MRRPGSDRRRRLGRFLVATAALLTVVTLTAVAVCYRLYMQPTADRVGPGQRVDAVLALGGEESTTTDAMAMARAGRAGTVVLSNPYGRLPGETEIRARVTKLCDQGGPGFRVICFAPDPSTTRGEARELGALAEKNGWTSVAVIAPRFHISRARYIVGRCFSGQVRMVITGGWYNKRYWAYQSVRQSAAFAKATLQRGC